MIQADIVLDAKGLACPMPIVKTRKACKEMSVGEVIEVQATDKGSVADLKAWCESAGHAYLGTLEKDGTIKHFIRKAGGEEQMEKKYPKVATNDELQAALENREDMILLDVRENAEYAFGHIPNALSVPLGELENQMTSLAKDSTIYVVCRTGNRSDLACQKMAQAGFEHVKNVVPGMSQWNGRLETSV